MTNDISGFGLQLILVASITFPAGLPLSQFADDSDPLALGTVQIGETAMGLNGDLITWARSVSMPATISVIPGSLDDINLQILADANRVSKGRTGIRDSINLTAIYPDGSTITLTGGVIISGEFGKTVSSAGRLKTKTYAFAFEGKIGA